MSSSCSVDNFNGITNDPTSNQASITSMLNQINGGNSCFGNYGVINIGSNGFGGGSNFVGKIYLDCTHLNQLIDTLYKTNQSLNCILTRHTTTFNTAVNVVQTIQIHDFGTIDCANGFQLTNTANGDVLLGGQLVQQDLTDTNVAVQECIQQVMLAVQSTNPTFASSTTGIASYQTALTKLNDLFAGSGAPALNQQVATITSQIMINQTVNLTVYGTIRANDCNIDNETILKVATYSVIDTLWQQALNVPEILSYFQNYLNEPPATNSSSNSIMITILISLFATVMILAIYYYNAKK